MKGQEFFIRCASGFESLLAEELKALTIKRIRPLKGGVAFFGTVEQAYRVCLWSRVASRVLLVLDRVDARDAEELYRGVQSIIWSKHIKLHSTIAVRASGANENLRNSQFTGVKTKDAICDQLRSAYGKRPDIEPIRPDVLIDVALRGDRATISIDFSGEPLHRRAYRKDGVQSVAPLKENLAAALILESGWKELARENKVFFDPLCGSGTLAIEAAMIAADTAPGILRDYWGFTGWAQYDSTIWDNLLDEADERFSKGLSNMPHIIASDHDEGCIELAKENAKRAGFKEYISFAHANVSHISTTLQKFDEIGLLLTNPPYGERLSSKQDLASFYALFSEGLDSLGDGWRVAVITPDESIDAALGYTPDIIKPFYNGRIETNLRIYSINKASRKYVELIVPSSGRSEKLAVMEENSEYFAARLKKVAKERKKWAKKNNISCYRIYDADLPDYAVAIDYYQGKGISENQEYLVIAEYRAPNTIDPDRARRRFSDALTLSPVILEIPVDHVFSKVRYKEKGGSQYGKKPKPACIAQTEEDGFLFELDLESYLDTGLFLDHRTTREMVGKMARGKRFLNLFAYTGSATVHAAGAGALQTTTVDLSQTYLNWAKRNMALNGFVGEEHIYIKGDTLSWLKMQIKKKTTYDVIFVDPPTFSNSKTMGKNTWSVERDHVELLQCVSQVLAPDGKAVFSCNLRNFKMNYEALASQGLEISDITPQTIPEDFKRNPKIHHCYLIKKAN